MDKEQFVRECEKADEKLSAFSPSADAKENLRYINDCIKIVTVTRFARRARHFAVSAVAFFGGAGILIGGIVGGDTVFMIAAIIIGALMMCGGTLLFVSHLSAVTHKAVCIRENGKVSEYIYSKNGGFIYNTVEGSFGIVRGKVFNQKNGIDKYEPSYPYVDFLDKDFSAFYKARTGEEYHIDETYEQKDADTIGVYYGLNKKTHKFTLKTEASRPVKMDYLNSESFVYARINDSKRTLFIPKELKGKVKTPPYLNVEYFEPEGFKRVWENL